MKAKTILVVDDDASVRATVLRAFRFHCDEFSVLEARDGCEALLLMRRRRVDFLLSDTHMPRMDGFQLMAYLMLAKPGLPVILMSSRMQKTWKLFADMPFRIRSIPKPLEDKTLTEQMRRFFDEKARGQQLGVTALGFLQILFQESKSCMLIVRSGAHQGLLHVLAGEVVHAHCDGVDGEEAAYQILKWRAPYIRVQAQPRDLRRSLTIPTDALLMTAYLWESHGDRVLSFKEPPRRVYQPVPDSRILKASWRARGWNLHAPVSCSKVR